jgi:hypothetical protein
MPTCVPHATPTTSSVWPVRSGTWRRIRAPDAPAGLAFACDAPFLAQMQMVNLITRFGDLDLSFEPSGTSGYEDLKRRAVNYDLGEGLIAPVAALEDVIRSKEAANREKDRAALPTLRALLERRRQLKTGDPGDSER